MKKAKYKYIPINIYRLTLTVFVGDFNEFYNFIKLGTKGEENDYSNILDILEKDKKYPMLCASTY